MASTLSVLVITGGHRVALDEFAAMFDAICAERNWHWDHAEQPAAQALLHKRHHGRWDAVVLHDLVGIELQRGREPVARGPDAATRRALTELLAVGQGLVVTHHSLASWPAWDGWAHAIGGRFLYAPGQLDGVRWPSSGYCHQRRRVRVVAFDHPVCAGVEDFEIDDEPYLCPILADEVVPLLAHRDAIQRAAFVSAHAEVRSGRQEHCRDHPEVAPLLGWAKSAGASPLVYLQPGDGPATFRHPVYRRLLTNAIGWVASPEAHTWARSQTAPRRASLK